ncbi:MAG: hypothetical protein ACAI34_00605, partial [Verrucomicrobium sp.]|nr:hypothetical protein [Verrucomicrobium sp.]
MTLPANASAPTRLWPRLLSRHGAGGMAMLVALVLVLAGSVTFAIEAEKPWGKTVQKRLAKGTKLEYREHTIIGLWWASVASAGVCAALLGTFPFWLPKKEGTPEGVKKVLEPEPPLSSPTPHWFWMCMAVVTLAGVW